MTKSIYRKTETLSSVAAGQTGETEPILHGYGHIRAFQIEAACQSSSFDLILFDKQGSEEGSINEVYRVESVEGSLVDDEFYAGGRLIFNSDATSAEQLYAKVKNNDQQSATGPIALRMYFSTVAHSRA